MSGVHLAADVAARLPGSRRLKDGNWLVRCVCAGHGNGKGDRNPSLSISDGDRSLRLHCFAGCAPSDILAELRRMGLLPDAGAPGDRERPARKPYVEPEPDHVPDADALEVWRRGVLVEGTLAETYLMRHRMLAGPFPPSIRFVERVRHSGTGLLLPAMVAAVSAPNRKVIAVQALALRLTDGAKAPLTVPRLTIGALGWGAVRLAPAGPVLGLAEGVEDALSAMQLAACPCWSVLGSQRMHRVAIPDTVRELHIFADADLAGQQAAERTADRHLALGRRVVIHNPPDGCKDFNDLLRLQRAPEGIAA